MNKTLYDPKNKPGKKTKEIEVVDGEKYKKCIAWRMYAGRGFACFEMCSTKQQDACNEAQAKDRGKAATQNKKL